MRAQLDWITTLGAFPNIHIAILKQDVLPSEDVANPFWIFDRGLVIIETYTAQLRTASRRSVELYDQAFTKLWGQALSHEESGEFVRLLSECYKMDRKDLRAESDSPPQKRG